MPSFFRIITLLFVWSTLSAAVPPATHAFTEEVMVDSMRTPTSFSLGLDAAGTAYTVDNKSPSAVRRVTPGKCAVVVASSPQLDGGRGLAVGPNGDVFVGATVSHSLIRVAPNGDVVTLMGPQDFQALTGLVTPWLPVAVAVDAAGSHVYVSDQNSTDVVRIEIATRTATVAYPRPATATRAADPVISPRGLVLDPAGNLFIAAGIEKLVVKLPADDGPAAIVVQDDPAGIRLLEPYSLRLDGTGNLYVAAFASNNVVKVTPDGAVAQVIGPAIDPDTLQAHGLEGPRDLAVTADGTVFVASAAATLARPPGDVGYGVFRVPPGGAFERLDDPLHNVLKKPKAIAVDHRGNVYVTGELSGNLVRIATQPGSCGNGVVDGPDEQCDYAAGDKDCCCTVDCTYQAHGALCASDANECTDDVCDGAGACQHVANTRPCTDDQLFCDGAEVCQDGACVHTGDPCASGPACANQCSEAGGGTCNVPANTPCPEDDNPCSQTLCDGGGQCVPVPGHHNDICRPAAGDCDTPELCTGDSLDCPTDNFVGGDQTCREGNGDCDQGDNCTGHSAACPITGIKPAGTLCAIGTCSALGECRPGFGGAGECGDGNPDPGEQCDLGPSNGSAGQCCTADCGLRAGIEVCRTSLSICEKDRTCAGSTDGTCPDGFPQGPNDQVCSPSDLPSDVSGCRLFRCLDGVCAQPICSVEVTPITPPGARLPQAFTVTCRQADNTTIGSCGAVGYLDASAILGGRGRTRQTSCDAVAARYQSGCVTTDPLLPYCRLVERKLGKDGALTGRCKRIVEASPGRRKCLKWLARLGQPDCTGDRATIRPIFRIETTLDDIVSRAEHIASTTVVKVCDRTQCVDAP